MDTKLAVILLSGLSVGLSLSAMAIADGEPVGYMDWSYAMGTSGAPVNSEKNTSTDTLKVQTNFIKTPESIQSRSISESARMPVQREIDNEALTLTYVDEAMPLPLDREENTFFDTAIVGEHVTPVVPVKAKCIKNQPMNTTPPQDLEPQRLAAQTVIENQIDTQYIQQPVKVQYPITRQYPISVQYPVTVQREVTVEQPVVMQQPVIVKRPVVMQQAITVQRPTTYLQQQPVVMQQQPTYIQQQPIVMPSYATSQLPQPVMPQPVPVMTSPVPAVQMQPMSMLPSQLPAAQTQSPMPMPMLTQQLPTAQVQPQMPIPPMEPITVPAMPLPVIDGAYQVSPIAGNAAYSYPAY